jgi:lysosomal acid lipase/cholesteryl ester hydrolase
LSLFRIRAPTTPDKGAPVVFLQHGILSSADCWIGNYPHNSPAFVFALEGYDVWLGNNRGTTHSRKHKSMNPDKDYNFWEYSFVELGKYDLPA